MVTVGPQGDQRIQKAKLKRAVKNLADVLGEIGVGGKLGLADVGIEVTNRVKRSLSQPGTGRLYGRPGVRGATAVLHRASAPGRPPAVDTGRLRASYTWRLGVDARGDFVEVGTNVIYAPFLEYGTRKMRARPHLRPAINEMVALIGDLVARRIIARQTSLVRRLPKEVAA